MTAGAAIFFFGELSTRLNDDQLNETHHSCF